MKKILTFIIGAVFFLSMVGWWTGGWGNLYGQLHALKLKTGSQGIMQFHYVDTDIDDTEEYELTEADAKAGWGWAHCGGESTHFIFTAAGDVTLEAESANVGTTNGTDNKFNIYDGGTAIIFENELGNNKELNINVYFVD